MIFKSKRTSVVFIVLSGVYNSICLATTIRMSTAFNQDTFPVFSSETNRYVLDKVMAFFKETEDDYKLKKGRFKFHISPFGVTADRGRTISGILPVNGIKDGLTNNSANGVADVPLGDIKGRINLIPLVFGPLPQGKQLPEILQNAKEIIFGLALDENGNIDDPKYIDPQENFGCFSSYLKYTKKGIRFGGGFLWTEGGDIGTALEIGVASVKQPLLRSVNKTENRDEEAETFNPEINGISIEDNVKQYLVEEFPSILQNLNLALADDASHTSVENIMVSLFWRHPFELIQENERWDDVLLIPYIEVAASLSPGKKKREHLVFDPVFGNNQHPAIGVISGIYLDFIETVYFGVEGGYVHFLKHDFANVPVPNSLYQRNVYPFSTDISVKPGANWHFAFKIGCDHFVDKVSMCFEYVMVEHKKDTVTLKNDDPAFLPELLGQQAAFRTKMCNIGFHYDFSPNASIGFLWQMPISQRNAYRSTTIMLSLHALL